MTPQKPPSAREDKNGHQIDADGNLTFDERCHGCDAPSAKTAALKAQQLVRPVLRELAKKDAECRDPYCATNAGGNHPPCENCFQRVTMPRYVSNCCEAPMTLTGKCSKCRASPSDQ